MTDREPPPRREARTPRVVRAALWVAGWTLHGLLLALVLEGLRPVVAGHAALLGLVASAVVVATLTWLVPEAPWWLWSTDAEHGARTLGQRALGIARLVHRDAQARKAALGDALRLHAALQAPALGAALALALGGAAWGLPALGVLGAPWAAGRLRTRVAAATQAHAAALEALHDEAWTIRRRAQRALGGATLTSAMMVAAMLFLVTQSTPARREGMCPPRGQAARVALPGPIVGTPLRARASGDTLWLETDDGGGPGAVALARGLGGEVAREPRWAWVTSQRARVQVTLCADDAVPQASQPRGRGVGYVLTLAPDGYRLDDDVAQRVLRGTASTRCAWVVLLALVALAVVGRPALLGASPRRREATPGRGVTQTVFLAVCLSLAQLTWMALVFLGR
ncbi:MAG: hypothetical protein R3B40_16185 [Polyangiales bacterium]|nr:hypothetical protein [Sandaracinaceae bacterium]